MKKQFARIMTIMVTVAILLTIATATASASSEENAIQSNNSSISTLIVIPDDSSKQEENIDLEEIRSELLHWMDDIESGKSVGKIFSEQELQHLRLFLKKEMPVDKILATVVDSKGTYIGIHLLYKLDEETVIEVSPSRTVRFYSGEGILSPDGKLQSKKIDKTLFVQIEGNKNIDGGDHFHSFVHIGASYDLQGYRVKKDGEIIKTLGYIVKYELGDISYINLGFYPEEFLFSEAERLWICGQTSLVYLDENNELVIVASDYGRDFRMHRQIFYKEASNRQNGYEHYWYINTNGELVCINEKNTSQTELIDENVVRLSDSYYVKTDGTMCAYPEIIFR